MTLSVPPSSAAVKTYGDATATLQPRPSRMRAIAPAVALAVGGAPGWIGISWVSSPRSDVALANKLARTVRAVMVRGEACRARAASLAA
jgi:hypothetical protein